MSMKAKTGSSSPGEDPRIISATQARALKLVLDERERQIQEHNWSDEHDDGHDRGELSDAAACYAMSNDRFMRVHGDSVWPWPDTACNRSGSPSFEDRLEELSKAGALVLAEMERLMRLVDARSANAPARPIDAKAWRPTHRRRSDGPGALVQMLVVGIDDLNDVLCRRRSDPSDPYGRNCPWYPHVHHHGCDAELKPGYFVAISEHGKIDDVMKDLDSVKARYNMLPSHEVLCHPQMEE